MGRLKYKQHLLAKHKNLIMLEGLTLALSYYAEMKLSHMNTYCVII